MKKIYKGLLAATLLTSTIAGGTAFAASAPLVYDPDHGYLISTQRIEDSDGGYTIEKIYSSQAPSLESKEPLIYDPDNGYLISTRRIEQSDGSYTIEKIYSNQPPVFDILQSYNTDIFRKTMAKYSAKGTLLLSCRVTATFDWSLDSQISRAYRVSGEVLYNRSGKVTRNFLVAEGNETEKSSVNYSFTRHTPSGAKEEYVISLACTQKGFTE